MRRSHEQGGAAAVPVVVYPADLRPGRRWYWLAVATALAGLAWAAVVLVLVVGSVDSFQRVPVPGTGQVSLASGQYVIYYEAPASVGGPVPLGHINVTPLSNPGAVGGITGYSGSLTYSLGSHQGTAIAVVQISRPGRFLVQATSSVTVPGARLAIGPSLTGWILTGVLPTLGLILAGIVVAVVVAVMRRKQRRVILIPPPWPSPPPLRDRACCVHPAAPPPPVLLGTFGVICGLRPSGRPRRTV
jgi:hypothetical protein